MVFCRITSQLLHPNCFSTSSQLPQYLLPSVFQFAPILQAHHSTLPALSGQPSNSQADHHLHLMPHYQSKQPIASATYSTQLPFPSCLPEFSARFRRLSCYSLAHVRRTTKLFFFYKLSPLTTTTPVPPISGTASFSSVPPLRPCPGCPATPHPTHQRLISVSRPTALIPPSAQTTPIGCACAHPPRQRHP